MPIITAVPTQAVDAYYDAIQPMLEKAANYTDGRYNGDDLLDVARDPSGALWLVLNENDDGPFVYGCAITRVTQYPQKRCLSVFAVAGQDIKLWGVDLFRTIIQFASDCECDSWECWARPQWMAYVRRYFQDQKTKSSMVLLEGLVDGRRRLQGSIDPDGQPD